MVSRSDSSPTFLGLQIHGRLRCCFLVTDRTEAPKTFPAFCFSTSEPQSVCPPEHLSFSSAFFTRSEPISLWSGFHLVPLVSLSFLSSLPVTSKRPPLFVGVLGTTQRTNPSYLRTWLPLCVQLMTSWCSSALSYVTLPSNTRGHPLMAKVMDTSQASYLISRQYLLQLTMPSFLNFLSSFDFFIEVIVLLLGLLSRCLFFHNIS